MCGPPVTSANVASALLSQASHLSTHGSSPLTCCVQALRVPLEKHDIPDASKDTILQSWRSSTLKQYGSYLRRWFIFCREGEDNPFSPHVNTVLRFLTHLYNTGLSYSTINSARSSISTISLNNDNISIGNNCFIRRFRNDKGGWWGRYPAVLTSPNGIFLVLPKPGLALDIVIKRHNRHYCSALLFIWNIFLYWLINTNEVNEWMNEWMNKWMNERMIQ